MKSTRNRSRLADQGTKEMLPVIFSLAWPTMLEQLMQTAVQYMDTGMVGVLGTSATAAVGATSTVNWLIGSTISAISIGFLAYISQSIGAGKKEQAKKASGQAVLTVVIVGIFFTILTMGLSSKVPVWMQVDPSIQKLASSYFLILYAPMLFRTANIIFGTVLRAVGDTKTPMQVGVAFNVINIVLNFFLIYSTRTVLIGGKELVIPGAGWGVQGAAAASAIAYTIGGIAITVKLWKHTDISPKGQSFLPDSAVLRPCLKVAVPNMFQRFATSLGYVAFASMINSLGETATAAHTIDNKKLNSLAKAIVPLEVGLMVISGSLLFIFAPILIRLFSSDAQVIRLGSTVLRMVAVSEPFYGVPIVIEGMMQGVGKTVTPFIFNVAGMWGVRILGTFICIHLLGLGLVSAWGCMIGHNMLLFVLFTLHYFSGRWNPMNKTKVSFQYKTCKK